MNVSKNWTLRRSAVLNLIKDAMIETQYKQFYSQYTFWVVNYDRKLFLKMGPPQPLFRLFSVFLNKQYNFFYYQSMWKNVMTIQYMALGFEPTTTQTWVVSHNHWTSGQFYKVSLSVFYNTRVVNISNLLVVTTPESKFTSVNCL